MAMPALGCSHKAETGIITIPSGSFSYCTELSDDGYVMVGRSQGTQAGQSLCPS